MSAFRKGERKQRKEKKEVKKSVTKEAEKKIYIYTQNMRRRPFSF